MPSYETLDAIADSYNPLLAGLVLVMALLRLIDREWRAALRVVWGFVLVAVVVYGLMFVDRALGIWSAAGLDYSTHTAEALGLVLLLSREKWQLRALWGVSLICYLLLMLYQRYHGVADIVTTAAVILVPLWYGLAMLYRAPQRSSVDAV